MNNRQQIDIRVMTRDEVELAVDWAAKEGWNPGIHDAGIYASTYPDDFLVGLVDDVPVAAVSAVRYDGSFGFVGFYIVRPEYRGRGYGIQMWEAAMKHLEGCNVGLDGVTDQQENYRKSGFRLAYRNKRYKTTGTQGSGQVPELVQLSSLPPDVLEAYTKPFFPADRTAFNRAWSGQADSHSVAYIKNGGVAGYGVMRQCRVGYKIGPLYADSPMLAEALFEALRSKVSAADDIFLDVPEVNGAALSLAENYDMEVAFNTARMYTGPAPDVDLSRVFGVTSFEIG